MFGRATITLGIGPHSSSYCCAAVEKISADIEYHVVGRAVRHFII